MLSDATARARRLNIETRAPRERVVIGFLILHDIGFSIIIFFNYFLQHALWFLLLLLLGVNTQGRKEEMIQMLR